MPLTPDQILEIQKIIELHHYAYIANNLGYDALPDEVIIDLRNKGMLSDESIDLVKQAYQYGQVTSKIDNPNSRNMSYSQFQNYLQKNPMPLNQVEQRAVAMAQVNAGQYCRGLGNTVDKYTGRLLIDADQELRAQFETDIKTSTALNVAKRESIDKLRSDLGWATGDWSRDLKRIAITEVEYAVQQGQDDYLREKYGKDSYVAKIPNPGACKDCLRIHIGPDGQPRIYKLSTLEANSNVGKKAADWEAVIGPVHPHCTCPMIRVPDGWGFDEDGELVPAGKLGVIYKEPKELELALQQEADLEKGLYIGPRGGKWADPKHTIPYKESEGKLTPKVLDSIKVLWRSPEGDMGLWGIPYAMNEKVGQSPKDLYEAKNTKDWIYLGGPGWFGSMSSKDIKEVKRYLATNKNELPNSPGEWSDISKTDIVVPHSVKLAAKNKNVKGPNGNEVIGYKWEWTWGLKESKQEDGLVDAKVSDWENAQNCTSCQRPIVHIYWVKDTNGKIKPYGGDHLNESLGYKSELSQQKLTSIKSKVTDINAEVAKQEKEDKYWTKWYKKTIDKRSASTVPAALNNYRKEAQEKGIAVDIENMSWVYNNKDKLVMRWHNKLISRLTRLFPEWVKSDRPKDDLQKAWKIAKEYSFQGIPIAIETPKGSTRTWVAADGSMGKTVMSGADYGYVKRTVSMDDDELDVFVGPYLESPMVWVIEQQNPDNQLYDEQKCMLGFRNKEDAINCYSANYDNPDTYIFEAYGMDVEAFKRWCGLSPKKGELGKALYVGPRGGKWADPKHTIPWQDEGKANRNEAAQFREDLVEALKNEPTFDRKGNIVLTGYQFSNNPKTKDLVVLLVPKGDSEPGLGKLTNGKDIVVLPVMKGPFDSRHLDTRVTKELVVHELSHFLDKGRDKGKPVNPNDLKVYFNHPSEFNAYFQEGANKAESIKDNWEGRNEKAIEYMFGDKSFKEFKVKISNFWDKDFTKYLSSKNKKKFDKKLYKLWEGLWLKKSINNTAGNRSPAHSAGVNYYIPVPPKEKTKKNKTNRWEADDLFNEIGGSSSIYRDKEIYNFENGISPVYPLVIPEDVKQSKKSARKDAKKNREVVEAELKRRAGNVNEVP